jgi:hypothetical protein
MAHDPVIFVTTDPSRWGTGAGGPQSASVHDNNLWNHEERITAAEGAIPAAARVIVGSTVVGDVFYWDWSDLTQTGPYPLPVATFVWRGDWQPTTIYHRNDLVMSGQSLVLVLNDHTSAATFDIGANGGSGLDYYQLMLVITSAQVRTATVASDGTWRPIIGDEQTWWVFAEDCTVILPSGVFATRDELHLDAEAGVTVTIDESTGGPTIRREDGHTATLKAGATASLKCIDGGANVWKLTGALVPG